MNTSLRRTVAVVLLLLACLSNQVSYAAQSLPFTLGAPFLTLPPLTLEGADQQWLEKRGVLRVGIAIADYEPVDITSDRNRYQGISADYLSLLSARLSRPVEVIGFAKREQGVAALLDGTVDILTSGNGFERGIESLAFSRGKTIWQIILPQCVKRMLPPWMNLYSLITMATVLASIVGVGEMLTLTAQVHAAEGGRAELFAPLYGFAGLCFFAYCWPISKLTQRLERRFNVKT